MNAVSNEPRSSKATCRIAVQIFLPTNDGSGLRFRSHCPLRSSVTASNELPSSNEKQMGQFLKSIAAPKASKPPELRNRRKIDFILAVAASRLWPGAGPGVSQDIGSKMGQWRGSGAARVEAQSQA